MRNDATMSDLMAIVEGFKLSNGEAESRIKRAVADITAGDRTAKQAAAKEAILTWRKSGYISRESGLIDTSEINGFLKKNYPNAKAAKGWKKSKSDVYQLASDIDDAGLSIDILDEIENLRLGGKRDVAKRVAKGAAKGAAKGVMGAGKLAAKTAGLGVKSYRGLNNINANSNARFESIVFEGKVSDVVIRDFFSALLDTFGEQETSEGFYRDNSYILENFMNVELSEIGMRHIIEMIDGHNRSGELDKLKRNVICKMSINEEATLGDIRKELMELQHVAHKL